MLLKKRKIFLFLTKNVLWITIIGICSFISLGICFYHLKENIQEVICRIDAVAIVLLSLFFYIFSILKSTKNKDATILSYTFMIIIYSFFVIFKFEFTDFFLSSYAFDIAIIYMSIMLFINSTVNKR